jgi:uncharacterized protein DUF6308
VRRANLAAGLRWVVATVLLRDGTVVDDPLEQALAFVEAYGAPGNDAEPNAFGEPDLRRANRGGARISAAEIAAILERRGEIELALGALAPEAALTAAVVPWAQLERLFDAFGGLKGVGLSKTTKALHPKRPAIIPMLDSVVQHYLGPAAGDGFGEQATDLVRAYKRDLDRNRVALREVRRELAHRGHRLTEVRILDVLIWSASAAG